MSNCVGSSGLGLPEATQHGSREARHQRGRSSANRGADGELLADLPEGEPGTDLLLRARMGRR
jgi:hypothetical protein